MSSVRLSFIRKASRINPSHFLYLLLNIEISTKWFFFRQRFLRILLLEIESWHSIKPSICWKKFNLWPVMTFFTRHYSLYLAFWLSKRKLSLKLLKIIWYRRNRFLLLHFACSYFLFVWSILFCKFVRSYRTFGRFLLGFIIIGEFFPLYLVKSLYIIATNITLYGNLINFG